MLSRCEQLEQIKALHGEGFSVVEIAANLELDYDKVFYNVRRHCGLKPTRNTKDQEIAALWTLNNTINSIATTLGLSKQMVRYALIRLGLYDPKAQPQYGWKERYQLRLLKRSAAAFSLKTRSARYDEESGLCQWCHLPIEGGWKKAVYHHIQLVSQGGTSDPANCMVLHHKCHFYDGFKTLHPGKKLRFQIQLSANTAKCSSCNRLRRVDKTGVCQACSPVQISLSDSLKTLPDLNKYLELLSLVALKRKELGLERADIAERLDCTKEAVQSWEKGINMISQQYLELLGLTDWLPQLTIWNASRAKSVSDKARLRVQKVKPKLFRDRAAIDFMLNLYLKKTKISTIVEELKTHGFKTRMGLTDWNKSSVLRIIRRELKPQE